MHLHEISLEFAAMISLRICKCSGVVLVAHIDKMPVAVLNVRSVLFCYTLMKFLFILNSTGMSWPKGLAFFFHIFLI